MSLGPGAYDDLCTYVREQAKARGAITIVFDGEKGSGFSVQVDAEIMVVLPDILENVAGSIRKDISNLT